VVIIKSKDLDLIVDGFYDDYRKAILIDGPWGCGKTFRIKNYIKELEQNKKKVYYLSLFGIESIEKINSLLYGQIYKNKKALKTISEYLTNSIKILPVIGNSISDNIALTLSKLNEKITAQAVIVFDDLERISKDLDYKSLLGYFFSLFESKIKIICLCSSKNIDQDKLIEFQEFQEKLFDRKYNINNIDENIISNFFNNKHNLIIQKHLSKFDNNLRLAQKTWLFFDEVNKYINQNNYVIKNIFTIEQLFLSCLVTIKICLLKQPQMIEETDVAQINYHEINKIEFGLNEANGLNYYIYEMSFLDSKDKIVIDEPLLKSLLFIFTRNDYLNLERILSQTNIESSTEFYSDTNENDDNIHKVEESKNDYELNDNYDYTLEEMNNTHSPEVIRMRYYRYQNVFLLSDNNKEKLSKKLFKDIIANNVSFDNDIIIKLFTDVIKYTVIDISKEERNKVISKMFIDYDKQLEKGTEIGKNITMRLRMAPYEKNKHLYDLWIKEINQYRADFKMNNMIEKINDLIKFKDYNQGIDLMTELINDTKIMKNKEIQDLIIQNNFLLPDLTGDITNVEWTFSHNMVKYVGDVDLKNDFIEQARILINVNMGNNAFKSRMITLITQYLDSNFKI
jgi:hypothetical protein